MTGGKPMYEPHPYALMLPPLTAEEYAALKTDIAAHGILYPAILDEDALVLDGVHRVRIAGELQIEVPVSQMGHLSDEQKMHLAVGLNMRRRQIDADRRRDLVRKLAEEHGLSRRKIASITGWSKSTVDRDLQTSPFEEMLAGVAGIVGNFREVSERVTDEAAQQVFGALAEGTGGIQGFIAWAEGEWKRGEWPPPPVAHVELTLALRSFSASLGALMDVLQAKTKLERDIAQSRSLVKQIEHDELLERWQQAAPETRERAGISLQERGLLFDPVPDRTRRKPRGQS